MKFQYFPGCTLKTKGVRLDACARTAALALGFTLEELPEWQCCGAVYPMARDEIATRLSSVRALVAAREAGEPLVTLCSACHHVIKRVNGDMKNDADIRAKVNNYLNLDEPYAGETEVLHYLEVLRDKIGWDDRQSCGQKTSHGDERSARITAVFYFARAGRCASTIPENPTILEDFIRAIGAEPVYYGLRNECCGGYTTIENRQYAHKQAQRIADNAKTAGAECLITACPLCLYNLTQNTDGGLPVRYFTELLAQALGVEEA